MTSFITGRVAGRCRLSPPGLSLSVNSATSSRRSLATNYSIWNTNTDEHVPDCRQEQPEPRLQKRSIYRTSPLSEAERVVSKVFQRMSDHSISTQPEGLGVENDEQFDALSADILENPHVVPPFAIALAIGDHYCCITIDRNHLPFSEALLKPVRHSLQQLRRWRCEGVFLLAWLMHICLMWTLHSIDTTKATDCAG